MQQPVGDRVADRAGPVEVVGHAVEVAVDVEAPADLDQRRVLGRQAEVVVAGRVGPGRVAVVGVGAERLEAGALASVPTLPQYSK